VTISQKPPITDIDTQAIAREADAAVDLLKALANPQRLRILCLLIEGERTVTQINARIPLSQSALSQHLAVLRDQGLVVTRRQSQTVFYQVAEGPAHRIIEILHDLYCPITAADETHPRCGDA
jgi:DNA-binding transcriptional ArsR family regulator